MIDIHPASMLALMVLLHLISDYTLQGCLANLKQEAWWDYKINESESREVRSALKKRYGNDYKAGLACHGLYWSLVVCLPLLMLGGAAYAINSVIHGIVHYVVDDMKANKKKINLIEDQLIHAAQVFGAWCVWMALRHG